MRKNAKSTARPNRPDIVVPADHWPHVDAAIQALRTTLALALQPLTESARRNLLEVGLANEAFTAAYVSMVSAEPGIVPDVLRSADVTRDWQTRAALLERRQALLQLVQQITDTVAALQSDCFATALIGYRFLTQGGVPPGLDPAVEPLREHWAKRLERKNATRARNLALKAAQEQAAPVAEDTVIPLGATSADVAPRDGAVGMGMPLVA